MAESTPNLEDPNDIPGNADSAPNHQNSDASEDTASELPQQAEPLTNYYRPTKFKLTRGQRIWLFRNRKSILGTGLVGTILGIILLFSIYSGPLQFVHFAKLMEQFHFSTLQDQQDNRFLKSVRFIRFAANGQVENTRLGYLGNKLAGTFESKLNASGYESAYSPKFGLFDGYVIDTENQKFKGKSPSEIKSIVKAETGIDAVGGESIRPDLKGKLVVNTSKLGFFQTRGLMKNILGQAGYSKLSGVIGSRLMCARAGCTLHPMKILSTNSQRALENWWARRNQTIGKGTAPNIIARNGAPKTSDQAAAEGAKNEGASTLDEAKKAAQKASTGDQSGIAAQKASLTKRIGLGGASVIGVACIAKGIDDNAEQIKQTQVVLPLIRQGIEIMSLGSQVQSNQQNDPGELAKYSQLLNGVDASGNKSSWIQADSIQAELGGTFAGSYPASDTLKSINKNSPFHFLNEGTLGTAVDGACNTIVQGALTVVSFVGAGVGTVVSTLAQSLIAPTVLDAAAQWFAGQAISPVAVGADLGNQVNYGSFLAANQQSILAGGTALSTRQAAELKNFENLTYSQDFKKQSLISQLFNPYDGRSVIGKLVDRGSSSFGQNLVKLGRAVLNIGHIFGYLANIFIAHTQAASNTAYDYGVPKYGFSEQDIDSPLVQNPYQNASDVEVLLSGSSGQSYIDRAKKCFGATISLVNVNESNQTQQWNVTNGPEDLPTYNQIGSSDCNDGSDPNWLKVRFFILDTETMNSMACYAGDEQACGSVDFNSQAAASGPPATSNPGPIAGSTYKDPFRDIANLSVGRIDQGVDYGGSGNVYAIGNGKINTVTTSADWPGGVFINYTLTDGPAAGKNVFMAEHCTPVAGLGETITTLTSSTVICVMAGGANSIETGWAADPSRGFIAMAYDVYRGKPDGDPTAFGQNFSDFMKFIGSSPGDISQSSSQVLLGTLPSGWPTW